MVSGLGLGKFNPVDMKEMTKSSSKASSFDPKSSQEVAPRSNNSSVSQNKSVAKNEKNSENVKTDKNEFSKKVEKFSKESPKSESTDKSSGSINADKLDKKEIKEAQNEIQRAGVSEIPQMAMLQGVQPVFVNQQAPVAEIKATDAVNLDVKVSEQTQPVLKFLKAMQENFGISPQQVMKALGEMNPETMMKSPQQAMTPLFEKLGLQPKQFTKAQILFTEMLSDMEKTQPELFKGQAPVVGAGMGMGAMAAKSSELPVQMMEKPSLSPKSTLDQLIEQKISRRALEPQNIQGGMPVQPQQPSVNMANVFNMPQPMGKMELQPEALTIDKLQQFDPNLRIEDVKINANKVTEQFLSDAPVATGLAGASAAVLGGKEMGKDSLEDQSKEQNLDQMLQMPNDKKIDGQFALDKLAAPSAAVLAGRPEQLSNENVEKLISGSQSLIQKGGGEMKIQMNPEGLGQIHLKIKVQDGQVGVQMTADTHEAKKLLESSMNDLKVSLADHKLTLNHTKVDVADQTSQNLNQGQDFKREEARDFLGQFRQFNESFRQSGGDPAALRAYRKTSQPVTPDIQPIESKKAEAAKAGGLYLVA